MPFFRCLRGAAEARIDEIPCIFPASREFGIFRDEFAADLPPSSGESPANLTSSIRVRPGRPILAPKKRLGPPSRRAITENHRSRGVAASQSLDNGALTRDEGCLPFFSGLDTLSSIFRGFAVSALGKTRCKTPSLSVASIRSRSMFSDSVKTRS